MHAINSTNQALMCYIMHQYYYLRCHQQTTTHLIYKLWPLSNFIY